MNGETESVPLIQWLVELVAETVTTQSLVAIGLGLVAGIIVVLLTRRESASDDFDSELTDLEERKAHAVAQLRELEAQRDRIDPEAYAEQRAEHERIAVDTLKARDELLKKRRRAEIRGFLRDQPVTRGLVWGGGILAALVVSWIIVSPDEIPPAQARSAARGPVAPMSPELGEVVAKLRQNPADIDALVRGSSILAGMQRFGEARQYIDRALQLDPEHPGALAQYAALLAADGRAAEALTRLDGLVEKHPELVEAWSLRSMVAMQAGDLEKARASLDQYTKLAPDGPAGAQIRAMLEGSPDTPTSGAASTTGAELWAAKCALCHGADGRAQTPMGRALEIPDMTSAEWQKNTTDQSIQRVITEGVVDEDGQRRMQAFPDLTPAEVESLLREIRKR
jgi:tetratricopeptide (TPR) repeat protein